MESHTCSNAVACIYVKREDPHEYVDKYLTLQSFVASYSPVIEPINGENVWEKADGQPIDPPAYHKRPGWPQKKRKRGVDEHTMGNLKEKRQNTTVKCSNCHKQGLKRRFVRK
ncbi:hypothetical protein K1719_031308 [Acacia pycnantha]|nr:hypothetical protein K1719_031308 [Acacia pycnantha]